MAHAFVFTRKDSVLKKDKTRSHESQYGNASQALEKILESLCFGECGGALSFDLSQILQVGLIDIAVFFERAQCSAGGEIIALPAAGKAFLFCAYSDPAFRRAAAGSARLLASHFHHGAQKIAKLLIVFERAEGWNLGQAWCSRVALTAAKLLSQIGCHIGDALRISRASAAVHTTIAN